jgi:hypothetical protein
MGCVDWAVEYEAFCGCGILEGGHHIITVYEYGESLRDPETYVQTFEFDVYSAIATETHSWGGIKIIYR